LFAWLNFFVCAAAELARPGSSIEIDAAQAFLDERIDNYKIPKTWSVPAGSG